MKKLKVSIASALFDKLLFSCYYSSNIFIFNWSYRHLSTITTSDGDTLFDVIWTPRGNILYTTYNNKIKTVSHFGKTIADNRIAQPRCLCASKDNIIYLIDGKNSIYQSADDCVSWSFAFNLSESHTCWKAIRVLTEKNDNFWIIERIGPTFYLRVHSINRKPNDQLTLEHVTLPTKYYKSVDFISSSLSHDDNSHIFLSDHNNKAIHVFSVSGQYRQQLLSSDNLMSSPSSLTMNKERNLLYVGQDNGTLSVLNCLTRQGSD